MKYTKQEKLYQIGEKIFPTDLSAFHRKDDEYVDHFDMDDIRDKIRKGNPFIVVSEPYEKRDIWLFEHEYYIDVKFKDSDVVYCIFNTKTNVFNKYWDMLEFVEDCEQCASMGY